MIDESPLTRTMTSRNDSIDPGQGGDFRREFSSIQKRVAVAGTAVFLIGAMGRVVRIGGAGMGGYEWLLLVAIVSGVAFYVYSWRCPSCKKYLGITWNPRFCRKCGARLQ